MLDTVKSSSVLISVVVLAGRAAGVALGVDEASESVDIVCEPWFFFSDGVELEVSSVSSSSEVLDSVLVECEVVLVSDLEDSTSVDFLFVKVSEDSTVSGVPPLASLDNDLALVLLAISVAETGVIKLGSEKLLKWMRALQTQRSPNHHHCLRYTSFEIW
jgi:hypothetical protein